MSGLRKTQVVLLTLMGAGTIAYFMPSCDRTNTTATTRGSVGSGGSHAVSHHTGFWPMFWGTWGSSRQNVVESERTSSAPSKSTVTRGGFGSSSSGSGVSS